MMAKEGEGKERNNRPHPDEPAITVYWLGSPSTQNDKITKTKVNFDSQSWSVTARQAITRAVKIVADVADDSGPMWFWWRSEKRGWQLLHTTMAWFSDRGQKRRVAQAAIDQWPPFGDEKGDLVLAGPKQSPAGAP